MHNYMDHANRKLVKAPTMAFEEAVAPSKIILFPCNHALYNNKHLLGNPRSRDDACSQKAVKGENHFTGLQLKHLQQPPRCKCS